MTTAVVGLGSRDRGDDAIGLVVADRLAALRPGASVWAWERPEVDLLSVLPGLDRVVVVDAARSGAPVGTVHDRPGVVAMTGLGTHGFGLAAVLDLAGALDRLPGRVDLLLVEIGGTGHGADLSPAVEGAVEGVVDRLVRELDAEVSRVSR